METKQIIFMVLTLFVGLLQFFLSRLMVMKKATSKKDLAQNFYVKQWGRNALVYAGFMLPFYYISPDKMLIVVIIYMGLLAYNGYLLKKGIRRAHQVSKTKKDIAP